MSPEEDPALTNRQYVNQAHIELRQRSMQILTVSALESLALIFLWQFSFSKESLLAALHRILSIGFILRAIPPLVTLAGIIVARKAFVQVQRPCYTSAWDYAHALFSLKMLCYAGTHILSAFVFFYIYHSLNGTGYMDLVAGPRGKTHLNAPFVYNTAFAVCLGMWSALDRVFRQRDHLQFPVVQRSTVPLLKARLPTILVQGFVQPIPCFILFNLMYTIVPQWSHRIYASLFGILADTTLYHPWSVHYLFPPSVLLRTYLAMALTVSAWEVTHTAFEVTITKAWRVSSCLFDPFSGLAYAMSIKNIPLIQRCAFLELDQRSRSDPNWRRALYEDAGRPGGRTAWGFILTPCLAALQDQRDRINPPAPPAGPPKPPTDTGIPTDWKAREFLPEGKDVMRSRRIPVSSVVQRDIQEAVDGGRTYLRDTSKSQLEKRGLLPWVTRPIPTLYAWAKAKALEWTEPWVKGMASAIDRVMRKDQERAPFVDVERTIWAAQALGTLVSASFSEDRYGVVQQDIPQVLSSLLDCLADVEAYAQKIQGLDGVSGPQIHPQCLCLIDVLRRTIYQIVVTFWDYLPQMKMDPKVRDVVRQYAGFST
ncbi:nucleoporin protein Ndc1-Nup [Piptocephalis cylindrospora]|uniref:Nucleoporin protein Ndc1-Nup n=1 Tax=Piptocephalis cylindrospora TaxID=1907219 RepID=A0A4P9Y1P2_9FUNG|nr:nucleoporin protein Ndc1-Nup [Piptocephalis cylindrospora]|eukprot:RKP12663.1 nucleoporin protein Ndc1-Nup [Piptocephalis cylindrospora]